MQYHTLDQTLSINVLNKLDLQKIKRNELKILILNERKHKVFPAKMQRIIRWS